ncbi:MAG: hypothetical protein MK102_11065 [Fuerstiella sp.]|nr:hypothetical protein [Fuerstiella sp.]
MSALLRTIWLAVTFAMVTPTTAQEGESTSFIRLEHGELAVDFRDNSKSPSVLSGIDAMFNQTHSPEYDAYDPDTRGASAGLNFEHIISGHQSPHNKFTPRHGPYTLQTLPGENSVMLTRRASDSPWNVASTLKYTVRKPQYVDFEFRCTPQDASLFGARGYALFFFANYMNDVQDISLHFRGHKSNDEKEDWIAADAPNEHSDWNGGGNYRAFTARELEYDDDVRFRLNTWSYEWPRIAKPFYYGHAAHGMTLILMFDRLHTEQDQIRFSLYKFKLPKHPRPAWDFQYVVNRVQSGKEYGFRGRLVWKKFVSPEDCLHEYEQWAATLTTAAPRTRKERVQQLKQLGATVFFQGDHVIEINANRTTITDRDLQLVSEFVDMTDLSLEQTAVGDSGLSHLNSLQALEWINLYRTQIGDNSLKNIRRLRSLQHLPMGETRVTDAGLIYLSEMNQLLYLGLRGNTVTNDGLKHLRKLTGLTGLHLGGTQVTDAGLKHLLGMTRLQNLWLNKTNISDKSIATVGLLKTLRELNIADTNFTSDGVKQLTRLLPRCHIVR